MGRVACNCVNPTHTAREFATGAFICNNCYKFIGCEECNRQHGCSIAEFIENGQYVCMKHAEEKSKRWNMFTKSDEAIRD